MDGNRSTTARGCARALLPLLGVLWTGCYEGTSGEGPGAGGGTEGGIDTDATVESSGAESGGSDSSDDPIPEVGCDGLRPARAPLRRLSDWQYRNTIDDLFAGAVVASDDFPATSTAFRFSSEPDANLVTDLAAEQLLIAAEDIGEQIIASASTVAPCSGGEDASCAEAFIEDFGPRAFRRPLLDEERALLLEAYEEAAAEHGHADGIARIVTVTLQLPAFIYLLEEGVRSENGTLRLTDHEVASRLSYLLWDTMPDDELRALADAGDLHEAESIGEQTRRMLADPRATIAVTRFHREWLEIRQLRANDKDAERFSDFDEDMIASMDEQLRRFVRSTLDSDDPSLIRLLTSSDVDVDASLAGLYGVAPPTDWTTISADTEQRAGILTLPAYLAAHASTDSTSAVYRGLVIRERVLCQELGSPPPGATDEGTMLPENATERDRTEALINNPECGACHIQMNPLGMGFEHYDAVGAWRETYPDGQAIDTEWEILAAPGELSDAPFDGAVELSQLLAGSEPVANCFVENWTHHSFGTAPGDNEVSECAMADLSARFMESGQSLPELIVAFTQTDGFRYRDISEAE